jgi:serine/threonine-protein kinase RsbW
MHPDRVSLRVPARSEYAKTVRLTAASLATRLGWSYDSVDDIRMAAEEAFIYAVDTVPEGGEVDFTFLVDEDSIGMEVALGAEIGVSDEDVERRTTYATFILEAVCDSYDLVSDAEGNRALRLVKRAELADDE